MDLEAHNLQQIRRTNQRGGRCLSIIDLLQAGTLSPEMAALCWMMVGRGAGFITGAVPGGAGKTTLMASLLAFLPPGERIVTAADHAVVERVAREESQAPICLLAHEIGRGSWFAYIWGRTARTFFSCNGPGRRPVTCLHADTPEQTTEILRECGVAQQDIEALDVHLYIRAFGSTRPRRRVSSLHCRLEGGLVPVYRWGEGRGEFERLVAPSALAAGAQARFGLPPERFLERWNARRRFLEQMQEETVLDFPAVRGRILDLYRSSR